MAITGDRGAILSPPGLGLPRSAFLFGADQARYVVETADPETVLEAAQSTGVPALVIGTVGGVALTLQDAGAISVNALRATNEAWLPDYMAQA
jgi:phosphoribosylformylglycinamidine synthase